LFVLLPDIFFFLILFSFQFILLAPFLNSGKTTTKTWQSCSYTTFVELGEKYVTHMMETAAGVFVVAAIATSGHDNFAAEDEIPIGPTIALSVN
jgi:hypothetical protein